MKQPKPHMSHGWIVALLVLICVPVHGQQSDTVQSSATTVKSATPASPPPLVQLDEQPGKDPHDQMNMLNPTREHAEPVQSTPGSPLPQMTTDANGHLVIARAKENFSNLTLEGSDLVAREPVFGSREEKPTFVRELWQLRWRPNDPIDLYIILPRNVKKPPVVLYLYGFPSDTDRFKDDRYCERVTRNGAAAIGFVSALTGQRYAFRPFKNWFISELPESIASTVHDVQMVLNQLKTREDLDLSRIGMYGQGSGAAIAILAATVDQRIQALDLLDPWGDWPDWFAKANEFPEVERAAYTTPEFQNKLEPLEPAKHLPALKDRRLRIQFVQENGEPEEAVKKLEAAAPSNAEINKFHTHQDLFNAYSDGRIFSWMATQLHAAPGQSGQAEAAPAENLPAAPPTQ